jgi:hypothetical protein
MAGGQPEGYLTYDDYIGQNPPRRVTKPKTPFEQALGGSSASAGRQRFVLDQCVGSVRPSSRGGAKPHIHVLMDSSATRPLRRMPDAFSATRLVAWDNSDKQQHAVLREIHAFAESQYFEEAASESSPRYTLPVFGGVVSPSGRRRRYVIISPLLSTR